MEILDGPYELFNSNERVTLCLMNNKNDFTVSKRKYDLAGKVIETNALNVKDLQEGLDKMESIYQGLKSEKYTIEQKEIAKPAPKPQKKREEKEERKSTRRTGLPKPVYDEAAIDKAILESQGMKGSGCIEVMLAQVYDPDIHNCKGWLMSEKLDGVRCYWNGTTLFSRNGNKFYAPDWWIDQLPKIALDGELWSTRNDFQKIVSIVRKQNKDDESWKKIKFMVFDAPLVKGNFLQRIENLKKLIDPSNKVVTILEQTVCKGPDQLAEQMDEILAQKGEGVMLKDPKSQYERKRSFSLLKVKRFEDAEATVIGHLKGTGRCESMCGAIQVREKDGTEFKIGSGFTD